MKDIILHGDVYACLNSLSNKSIAAGITSPPYWKQRDYGYEEQIGQEQSPEEYIGRLVTVFDKLKEKMRDDGIFFLNVGDKYLNRYGKSHLLQIPYRLAFHMVKRGWLLEDVIIWYKPNHLPSSVKDRFTNTYEPVLVFSKKEKNIYRKELGNILKIQLQQIPWKHTAAFPENLVSALLQRLHLNDGDLIIDPFAGTGTVAQVVRTMRSGLFTKKVYSIMIEMGTDFIDIIKKRVGLKTVKTVDPIMYEWQAVKEEPFPRDVEPFTLKNDKHGEVFLAENSNEFLSALKGAMTNEFKRFHREDALYFFGIKQWTLQDLYHVHSIMQEGYVLRNMIIISNKKKWYPVFMFARDNTRVQYKFYLDRIRIQPKTGQHRNWWKEQFIGLKVRDISRKRQSREGEIIEIIKRHEDGFPKIVLVQWKEHQSVELVIHPKKDEILMESLQFKCPHCKEILEESFDPIGQNTCSSCGMELWRDLESLPLMEELSEIKEDFQLLKKQQQVMTKKVKNSHVVEIEDSSGKMTRVDEDNETKKANSKFWGEKRINWGASPGARYLMVGEYFTKMRLYRIDQPLIAQYLTIQRKHKGLTIQGIISQLPPSYRHTVGHWFRKDFGGSVPIPEDIPLLKKVLGDDTPLLELLEKTVLKFQTVKTSIRGKNPGDFLETLPEEELITYFRRLYLPSRRYLQIINGK